MQEVLSSVKPSRKLLTTKREKVGAVNEGSRDTCFSGNEFLEMSLEKYPISGN